MGKRGEIREWEAPKLLLNQSPSKLRVHITRISDRPKSFPFRELLRQSGTLQIKFYIETGTHVGVVHAL